MEARGKRFEIPAVGAAAGGGNPLPREAGPIPAGADVSGIIFRHASARGASNDMSYRYIHNFPNTAGLPGGYQVVYDDGFVDTVPVRFGKAMKEIRLHNAIILAGVSVVKKRPVPPAETVSR